MEQMFTIYDLVGQIDHVYPINTSNIYDLVGQINHVY